VHFSLDRQLGWDDRSKQAVLLSGGKASAEAHRPSWLKARRIFLFKDLNGRTRITKEKRGEESLPKFLAGCVVAQFVSRDVFFADGAVENLDHVGFQFNRRGFDHVLDGLVTVQDLDGLVVEPCEMLALHEDVRAFDQPVCELGVRRSVTDYVVPLSSFAPLVGVFVLPRNLGRDGELGDRRSVLQVGNFASFPYES